MFVVKMMWTLNNIPWKMYLNETLCFVVLIIIMLTIPTKTTKALLLWHWTAWNKWNLLRFWFLLFYSLYILLSKRCFMIHIITRHNSQFTHECEFLFAGLLLPWVIIIIIIFLFLKSINTNKFIIWQFHQKIEIPFFVAFVQSIFWY